MKTCTKCHEAKELAEFNKRKDAPDGYRAECKKCSQIRGREWHKNNRGYASKSSRLWRKNNPGKTQENNKKWLKNNPGKARQYWLKKKYGITIEEYDSINYKQGGVCAICQEKESILDKRNNRIKYLSTDHDHKTGRLRGLLCNKCNKALGLFKDKLEILLKAIKYLEKSGLDK